jgi:hypothetical protein
VSGAAGLLASFDPAQQVVEIKDLLIEGAQQGGRTAGAYPLLNAYESLKLAAQRPRAPLCGNHVWSSEGNLFAMRGFPEVIDTLGSPLGFLEVLHGGKFIRHVVEESGQAVIRYVSWDEPSRRWDPSSPPVSTVVRGGTLRSMIGRSHDRDSAMAIIDAAVNFPPQPLGTRWYDSGSSVNAGIVSGDTLNPQFIGNLQVNNLPEPIDIICVEIHIASGACNFIVYEQRRWRFRVAYPQFPESILSTRTAFVTVSAEQVISLDSTATDWHTCAWDSDFLCREFQSQQRYRDGLVYSVDVSQSSTPALVQTLPDRSIYWIAQGESARDVVFAHGRYNTTHWFSPDGYRLGVPEASPGFSDFVDEIESCTIEYRERASFTTPLSAPLSVDEACPRGELNYFNNAHPYAGAGTIAPRIKTRLHSRSSPDRRSDLAVSLMFRQR